MQIRLRDGKMAYGNGNNNSSDINTIEELLTKGRTNRKPVLVHGTSMEAIFIMLETGVLPSSGVTVSEDMESLKDHPAYNGHLFFVPRKSAFKGTEVYAQLGKNWNTPQMESYAQAYSELNQWEIHLARKCKELGLETGEFQVMTLFGDKLNLNFTEIEYDAERIPKNTLLYYYDHLTSAGQKRFRDELWRNRGAVIGMKYEILDLKIEVGCDEPDAEVSISLPNGLPIRYVDYVRPVAAGDKERMRQYLSLYQK